MTPKLILASTSKYRKAMLDRLGHSFSVIAPGVDETPLPLETPKALAMRLSLAKARAVSAACTEGSIIIGSDQTATLDGIAIVGKPGSHLAATKQLAAAAGKTMTFHSGLAVICPSTGFSEVVSIDTQVHFRPLQPSQIEVYLRREEPYDCTGSAKIESLGIALVSRVTCDDPTALVGLPLIALVDMLARAGLDVLQ
jgi:septum formation protein